VLLCLGLPISGEPKRDLTFVEDTARAFMLAAEVEGIEGETIHFVKVAGSNMEQVRAAGRASRDDPAAIFL
jgi:nucleoside-diphosphate-sugar epimerase